MALRTSASAAPVKPLSYWHLLPFAGFLLLNGVLIYSFYEELARIRDLLSPWYLVLLGLATYRIANIIANEEVTRVVRAPFVDVEVKDGVEVEVPKRRGFRQTIGSLIYCPSCVGVWVSAGLVYLLVFAPTIAWILTAIFAVSALERFCTGLFSWIGGLAP